jgi:hypothetical protein
MKIQVIAAAMMLVCVTAAEGHSWYPHDCCHDNDCKPVPCAELSYHDQDVVWRNYIYFSGAMIRTRKTAVATFASKKGSAPASFLICRSACSCPKQQAEPSAVFNGRQTAFF